MANGIAILAAIVYYISFPLIFLFHVTALVLAPVWKLTSFLLLPLIHLIRFILAIITFPFGLNLLEKLEALYVFFGIAALIGILAGLVLHLCYSFIATTLGIDTVDGTQPAGRTMAEYREARVKRKKKLRRNPHLPPSRPILGKSIASGRLGLHPQTIIEEEDSE